MSIIQGVWANGEFYIPTASMVMGFMPVKNLAGKAGLLRQDGSVVGKIEYDEVGEFDIYCSAVKRGKFFAIMDSGGKRFTDFLFQEVKILDKGTAAGRRGDRWCIVNVITRAMTPFLFDEVEAFRKNYTIVRMGRYYGALDLNGSFIVDPEYDYVSYFTDGIFQVKKDNLYGIILETGEMVGEVKLTLSDFYNEVRRIQKN